MKTNLILALLERLEPILKKHFGEILFRIHAPTSPFFRPIIKYGVYIAVLAALLASVKDKLISEGVPLPGWFALACYMISAASSAVSMVSALSIDQESLQKLNQRKQDEVAE